VATFDVGGVIVGKYEVTRVLGQGGMGVVVEARHLVLGELVAIKSMHAHVGGKGSGGSEGGRR
jgi:serine/threonine protein kinase